MASSNSAARRCVTPVGTLSFPHFFTPQDPMEEGGKAKFGGVLVFAGDTDLSELKRVVQVAGVEYFGVEEFKRLLKAKKIRLPFRNGDDEDVKRYPEGSVFINAKSDTKPGLASRYRDPSTGKAQVLEDPEAWYPGALTRFSVTAFGYDVKGNKGIAFALNNAQKMGDGPRLDSRVKAEDEFDAEAPVDADLTDLDPVVPAAAAAGEADDLTALM
jgi:hypothetical protein